MRKNVLVFPCGSEIGLEIYNALKYEKNFSLLGASSVDDHGKFVYEKYIKNVPFVDAPNFISSLNKICRANNIDFIFPAHDSVVLSLAKNINKLAAVIVGSPYKTSAVCRSKLKTYNYFKNVLDVPRIYDSVDEVDVYPVFVKPEVGQGSKGTHICKSREEIDFYRNQDSSLLILEYLPGDEYTVDCFTDRNGKLLFCGARSRSRILNGISVNTSPITNDSKFKSIAEIINATLKFNGSWFFQVKKDASGKLKLLEIAPRIAGSMALYRNLGVNFPLLSLWNLLGKDILIIKNKYNLTLDRALGNKFRTSIKYKRVYVDLDDCLIVDSNINLTLITFLYQCINNNIPIVLITRHKGDVDKILRRYSLQEIFSEKVILKNGEPKSNFIEPNSIVIDDSFSERFEISNSLGIPVFEPSMVESLLN